MLRVLNKSKLFLLSLTVIMIAAAFAASTLAVEEEPQPALFFQSNTGDLKAWFMDGPVMKESIVFAAVDDGWEVKAVADVDGDNHPDLFIYNKGAGLIEIWLMEGLNRVNTITVLNPGTGLPYINPDWEMMAVCDLSGNGEHDIIWQRDDGELAIWLMENQQAYRTGRLYNQPGQSAVNPDWEIGAVTDLTGGGQPEIIWQAVSGEFEDELAYWNIDVQGLDFFRSASGRLTHTEGRANIKSWWRLRAALDLFEDGTPEIFFQGISDGFVGEMAYWKLDGVARLAGSRLDPRNIGPDWKLVAAAEIIIVDTEEAEISVIDVYDEVANITVFYGTSEADAIKELVAEITIKDTGDVEHNVALDWIIVAYDGNTAGNYIATGFFELPAGLRQTDPPTPLEVTATVTVKAEPATTEKHEVTFSVVGDNGTLAAAVEGESISFGDEVEAGKDVVFTAVPDSGYQVKEWKVDDAVVAGHNDNTYTVENLQDDVDVTVEFAMLEEPPVKYTITFEEENSLEGVAIKVYNDAGRSNEVGDLTTVQDGKATIDLEDGDYWFTAILAGYVDFEADFEVDGADKTLNFEMELVVYDLTFVVEDESEDALEGARVTVTGVGEVTTDAKGEAVFQGLEPGTYAYAVSKARYSLITDSVEIDDADITENVTLELIEFSVNVPTQGNSWFFSDPQDPNPHVYDIGSYHWSDPVNVLRTYFRVKQPGKLNIGLLGSVEKGSSQLEVIFNGIKKVVEISDQQPVPINIGTFQLSEPGYYYIDLKGISKESDEFAEISDILLCGSATESGVNYITEDYFYWGRRGPSVHLWYDIPQESSDILWFYNEVTVPEGNDVQGSFFMVNGFGEGYFGFQVNSDHERRVLFSVWSPHETDDPDEIPEDRRVELIRKGQGVIAQDFGGEGSGGQSYLIYDWQPETTYRFLLKGEPAGNNKTDYTAYFFTPEDQEWKLIASWRRPMTNTYLKHLYSFLENFLTRTGPITRKGFFNNQWIMDTSGQWHELTRVTFTADMTALEKVRLDYTGGFHSSGKGFFLKNCGFFNETTSVYTTFTRPALGLQPSIDFSELP